LGSKRLTFGGGALGFMAAQNWILLVDPFRNLVNAYRMILEAEKYGVDTAGDLEAACAQFGTREYSIVIIEYFPPYDDTCQIIRWMKQKRPEVYIIMVTNITIGEIDYGKLFDLGLDDLILKPYSPEKILVHIQKGLRQGELILKKQELEKQNVFDPCSPKVQKFIFNHMFFQRCLRQEMKRAKRHGYSLSIVLVKVPSEEKKDPFDNFCNEMARILRSYIREEDIVGRENGSFEILLPETDQAGSRALLQRLSSLIEKYPPFRSDDALKPFLQTLSLQAFTYPEIFGLPRSLSLVLEDIDREPPQR
jgi:PleD family two-component response regulator